MVEWLMNDKATGKKQLWLNQGIVVAFAWRD
jgi:hypothetical protein